MFSDFLFRLRALFRRNSVESELDAELRAHLEDEAAKYVAAGVSRDEAIRRARLTLGGLEQIKEQCRDARGTRWLEDLLQDFRYAIRTLRQRPGFAAVALLTLALGQRRNDGDVHGHQRRSAKAAAVPTARQAGRRARPYG